MVLTFSSKGLRLRTSFSGGKAAMVAACCVLPSIPSFSASRLMLVPCIA